MGRFLICILLLTPQRSNCLNLKKKVSHPNAFPKEDHYLRLHKAASSFELNESKSKIQISASDSAGNSLSCPQIPSAPTRINPGSNVFQFATEGTLCTLTKIEEDSVVGVARSYDRNPWEVSAGEFATSLFSDHNFICNSQTCIVALPSLQTGDYYLTTYTYSISLRDELARFLESATFGITQSELSDLEALTPDTDSTSDSTQGKITKWIKDQISVPFSSHRELWREGLNPRLPIPGTNEIPNHPCDSHSRWRKYAFVYNDAVTKPGILRIEGSGPYILRLDNNIRAVVKTLKLIGDRNYRFNPNFDYKFCADKRNLSGERVNGILKIQLEDGKCTGKIRNPKVDFTNHENLLTNIVNLPSGDRLQPIDEELTDGEDFILTSPLQDPLCDSKAPLEKLTGSPTFGKLPDGSWLQFDPRLELKTNSKTQPRDDGGYAETKLGVTGGTYCMNAPRTFLNEDGCFLSSSEKVCGFGSRALIVEDDAEIKLDEAAIIKLHELTGQYVYGVKGLPMLDIDNEMVQHPCTQGTRSRWILKESSSCSPTFLKFETYSTLFKLIEQSSDNNAFMRDIYFPSSGIMDCHAVDKEDARIEIYVNGECWSHVHPDHMSIFDMTHWTLENKHPGGQEVIKNFAKNRQSFLVFPGESHPISRWNMYNNRFPYIGRFGDKVLLRNFPTILKNDPAVTEYFGNGNDDVQSFTDGVLVCGSPGEVENKKENGLLFDSDIPYLKKEFKSQPYNPGKNREYVWIMIVLSAPDQLRQRLAWALSQILVVATPSIKKERFMSEWFLNFYDIFVRHAFGNYRDVLKEISYNALMAENLSFLDSKSFAYNWKRLKIKAHADENFAREIMQLFTIGTIELNQDGTAKLDSEGNKILSYTNEDIMSFSRAWTGFKQQKRRSNIEGRNYIDPMEIRADWRDRFPKTDLYGGYIGDSYPLCEDLPSKAFLKKGAMYRLLGNSRLPDLMEDPEKFASDNNTKRFVLEATSGLKTILCNENISGECHYQNSVAIESALHCIGSECDVDSVRVVQVAESVFYEYVQPPCVQQMFYDNAKKLTPRKGEDALCGNPLLPVASTACCKRKSNIANANLVFDGERMTFALSKSRCSDISRETCDYYTRVKDVYNIGYFWTNVECSLRVKVNLEGLASIVHESNDYTEKLLHVNDENENWFKVIWDSIYPSVSNGCYGICELLSEGLCLCNTNVVKTAVFDSMPESISDAISKLHIGAFHPSAYGYASYSVMEDISTSITAHLKNGQIDMETIFEFTDDKGRKRLLKNKRETVELLDTQGLSTSISFRNMPHFMSLIPDEETVR